MRDWRALGRLLSALALLVAADASAQTLTRGPFVQNPGALTTTMSIAWWTSTSGDSTVEYGTTTGLGQSVTVPTAGSCEIGAAGTCHIVPLTGLLPGTRYYYQLKTNGVVVVAGSASLYFQTFKAPSDTSDLHFTIIGDWGSGSSATTNVANNQNAADPPLILTTGDNAYENGTQSDWDNNAIVAAYENNILRRAIFMPALGNHDLNNVGAANWASSVEIKMFQLPRNAPAGQEERYFSFDHGDVHFVVLDSNPPAVNAQQTAWLDNDLATTTRKWVFVFFHHVSYSCATGFASLGSDHTIRDLWGPLFEEYEVDMVFTGHDHLWERSNVVDDYLVNGSTGQDGKGTRYIMTGGGGKTLDGDCDVDGGGAYGQGFTHPKEYCPWLATGCAGGPTGSGFGPFCSRALFHHTDVRLVNNTTLTIRAIDQSNNQFDSVVLTKNSVCGNGAVEGAEECDDTGPCCDDSTCEFVASGTVCRSAAAGGCDVAETCTGSASACPANGFASSSTVCRSAAASGCDVAETCTGSSASCPANGFASSSTVCRSAAGACDVAETCTGSSAACPANGVASSGTTCRSAAGACDAVESCDGSGTACPGDAKLGPSTVCNLAVGDCDVAETCTGSGDACPSDVFAGGGTTCRSVAGVCDVAETCTGSSPVCPPDGFLGTSTVCRSASGVCDVAESCTGGAAACPGDGFVASGTTCRSSAGLCDPAESCTGSSGACPSDALASSTTVCRTASGACDVAETCTGSSVACPSDGVASSGTVCRSATAACDVAETCDGSSSACPANGVASSGTVCRSAAGDCDVAEICNGSGATCPSDGFATSGTVCRSAAGGCDLAESCSGSSAACPIDAFASNVVVCRSSAGDCDVGESCTGSSAACPPDAFAPSVLVCRASVGPCDLAESCTGAAAACPADGFRPTTFVCRSASGLCDAAESCTGSSALCPPNGFQASATVCRSAAGACDVAETCTGSSATCPGNGFAPSSTVCRSSTGSCDAAETCSGSSATCPADAMSGTAVVCRTAAGACDEPETCPGSSGICPADGVKISGAVCRSAAGDCDQPEHCDGASIACPADTLVASGTVCRSSAGLCDVAESCNGSSAACPADQLQPSTVECRPAAGDCDVAESCTGTAAQCPADTGQPDGDDDGVCDLDDGCPTIADPGQADTDGDGTGDVCDPCNNFIPVFATKAKITIQKLVTPPGDDRFKFTGYIQVPETPFIDPASNDGVRVLVHDSLDNLVLDVAVPPGAYDAVNRVGWRVNGSGTSYTYKNAGRAVPLVQGIYKAQVKKSTKVAGEIKFTVAGKTGSYALNGANMPLTGTFVIDAPYAVGNQCGEATFEGPLTSCTYVAAGGVVKCK